MELTRKDTIELLSRAIDQRQYGEGIAITAHWMEAAEAEIERLRAIVDRLPKFLDGPPIIEPGPCFTPDGRGAYVENMPIANIKHATDADQDEYFKAEECYSTQEAAETAGVK